MDISIVENILKDKIGLEGNRINSNHIAKVVAHRMSTMGQADFKRYVQYLQTSSREFEALIESVVVPETWFFRDAEAFNFLSLYVKYTWLLAHAGKVLRILSIPCSTGEEPYSIAITLLESGLTPNQFKIDAVDISQVALSKGRAGIYRENSFRGGNLTFRDRYFKKQDNHYCLYNWIKQKVNFLPGNLIDPLFLSNQAPYHLIWCRNLLIYFDRNSQAKAFKSLDRLLDSDGLLFLGYAEFGTIKNEQLISIRHPRAFAYRKVVKSRFSEQSTRKHSATQPMTSSRGKSGCDHVPMINSSYSPSPLFKKSDLEWTQNLANEGRLEEAKLKCEAYIQNNRTSSQGYLLLGEIEQALGNNDVAEANFSKAIYLNPDCYEALVHLAQLQELRGDNHSAAIIRQRIQRLLETV